MVCADGRRVGRLGRGNGRVTARGSPRCSGAARPDCVVPKTSAGQGLRAVLNACDRVPRVVATRGEFDSLDVILREYARRGRIALDARRAARGWPVRGRTTCVAAIVPGTDLVVDLAGDVPDRAGAAGPAGDRRRARMRRARACCSTSTIRSACFRSTSRRSTSISRSAAATSICAAARARASCTSRRVISTAASRTLDIGWFAKESPFAYERPDPPRFAAGGDAWLESTPAVLPFYQARAGQVFTRAVGVGRLREYSLAAQQRLVALLAERGVAARGRDDGSWRVRRRPCRAMRAHGRRRSPSEAS